MRLSKDSIREIIIASKTGETQAAIARRFSVDVSTVRYHVQKFEGSYIYGNNVYALIKAETQHECHHPSMKCAVCGKRVDMLLREERVKIIELERELATYRNRGDLPHV